MSFEFRTAHKFFVFGPSGSGKTTYLSALYHKLCVDPDIQTLRASVTERTAEQALKSKFDNLRTEFASQTNLGEFDEVTFRFHVTPPESALKYDCTQVTFFDYSGELLEQDEPSAESALALEKLGKALKESAGIIIILDGVKLKECLDSGRVQGALQDNLYEAISFLDKLLGAAQNNNTLNVMITKWDQLEDSDTTIAGIRKLLLDFVPFRKFAYAPAFGRKLNVRLVPVSAVGFGVARQDHGQMRIIDGARPRPVGVDIPIATLVVDCILSDRQRRIDQETQRASQVRNRALPERELWRNVLGGIGSIVREVGSELGSDAARSLGERMQQPRLEREHERDAAQARNIDEANRIVAQVNDAASAHAYAAAVLNNVFEQYVSRYPSHRFEVASS